MMAKPRIALLTTGGTIASLAASELEVLDYGDAGTHRGMELIEAFPCLRELADFEAFDVAAVPSFEIYFAEWRMLLDRIDAAAGAGFDGVVVAHGTGTLEETAYFLTLTLKVDIPIVLVGAQRPASALSSDAGMNLVAAVRVASDPSARGLGALVVMNDEIHLARDVAKTATLRLDAFRSPGFGPIGTVDGPRVSFYRKPTRRTAPDTEFDVRGLASLPKVDILYCYTGSDGTLARALVDGGSRGVVSAGFAPGYTNEAEAAVLREAVEHSGLVVVQASRAGSGRTFASRRTLANGFIPADDLSPVKARLLLALCLTITDERAEIARLFAEY